MSSPLAPPYPSPASSSDTGLHESNDSKRKADYHDPTSKTGQKDYDLPDSHAQPAEKGTEDKNRVEQHQTPINSLVSKVMDRTHSGELAQEGVTDRSMSNLKEQHQEHPPSYMNWVASQEYQADHPTATTDESIQYPHLSTSKELPSSLDKIASQERQIDHPTTTEQSTKKTEERPSYFNWTASQEYQADHQDSDQEFPPLFGSFEEEQKPSVLNWVASQEYQADHPSTSSVKEYTNLIPEEARQLATSAKDAVKDLQQDLKANTTHQGKNLYQRMKDSILSTLHLTSPSQITEASKGSDVWMGDLKGDWRDIDNFRRKAQLAQGGNYFPGFSRNEIVDVTTGYNDWTYFGN